MNGCEAGYRNNEVLIEPYRQNVLSIGVQDGSISKAQAQLIAEMTGVSPEYLDDKGYYHEKDYSSQSIDRL